MKLHIIVLFVCSMLISSCSLEEQIYDMPTVNMYLNTEQDVYNQMTGIYGLMSSYSSYKFQLNCIITYGGDDAAISSAAYRPFLERTVSPSNAYFTAPWGIFYQVINNSNSLIETLSETELFSDEFKRRIMGELYFLRGYSYFNLVRLFGGVPIQTESTDGNSDFYPARNTAEEVYQLVLDDLAKASEQCLPFSEQPADEFGRATKGAAQGMLALAWLTYGNMLDLGVLEGGVAAEAYQQASDYADLVLTSGEYALIADYADLWDVNQERDAYQEVIFAIQFTRDATAASASSKGSEYAWFYQPSRRDGVSGNITDGVGTGILRIQPWFYDSYNQGAYEGDYRTEVSFVTRWTNGVNGTQYITYPEVRQAGETVEQFPYLDKYRDPDGLQARNNENDLFVLRLAEIHLIKAEAENELHGPTAVAYEHFNKLRERARMANGTVRETPANLEAGLSKEAFRLKIFHERGLELVGEGHRWFDAVRMRYTDNVRPMIQYQYEDFYPSLDTRIPTYSSATNTWGGGKAQPLNVVPFSRKFLIWPIPSPEIDANPNITQNEGW